MIEGCSDSQDRQKMKDLQTSAPHLDMFQVAMKIFERRNILNPGPGTNAAEGLVSALRQVR